MLERNIIIICTVVVLTSIIITFLIYMLVKSDQIVISIYNLLFETPIQRRRREQRNIILPILREIQMQNIRRQNEQKEDFEKNFIKQNYIVIQSPDNQFAIGIENNDMPPLSI